MFNTDDDNNINVVCYVAVVPETGVNNCTSVVSFILYDCVTTLLRSV